MLILSQGTTCESAIELKKSRPKLGLHLLANGKEWQSNSVGRVLDQRLKIINQDNLWDLTT